MIMLKFLLLLINASAVDLCTEKISDCIPHNKTPTYNTIDEVPMIGYTSSEQAHESIFIVDDKVVNGTKERQGYHCKIPPEVKNQTGYMNSGGYEEGWNSYHVRLHYNGKKSNVFMMVADSSFVSIKPMISREKFKWNREYRLNRYKEFGEDAWPWKTKEEIQEFWGEYPKAKKVVCEEYDDLKNIQRLQRELTISDFQQVLNKKSRVLRGFRRVLKRFKGEDREWEQVEEEAKFFSQICMPALNTCAQMPGYERATKELLSEIHEMTKKPIQ